ncbi:MAG: RidA family protein [Gemmatimonadota bacterium]
MGDTRAVHTDGAPAALGPYSQAIVAGGFVYTAGQIPLDPDSGEMVEGGVEVQAERVLENLGAILAAAGSSFSKVVKTTVFLSDMDDYAAVNEVYARYFREPYPARSAVEVARLPRGVRLEIEAVARID